MKEKIFVFHVDEEIKRIMTIICHQLEVDVVEIDDKDVCQSIGYILGVNGYERCEDVEFDEDLSKEFIFFVGMSEEQINLLLEIFKQSQLPFIPYKSMLTERNIEYPFYELYRNVAYEYKQMAKKFN